MANKEILKVIEAFIRTNLRTIDQNQVTLKKGNHGKIAKEYCEEDVNSQLTIKN